MGSNNKNIPMRSTSGGPQIDTRPLHVEEWLDSLPYIDFQNTSQLLFEATRATNEQQLKPAVRLELVEIYNRPYQYYIDSQIKAGAQHTLQSIETVQQQIKILKKIAINLALACKLSAEDSLRKKTLWGQTRPPLTNYYMALNYLSHALIFSYLEYAPTPKNVWKEIHFIYGFAESLVQENSVISLPKSYAGHGINTISQAYKRIVLASLADPHHLPYGAIWEIYEQLSAWITRVDITRFCMPPETSSRFVVNLDSDSSPLPYAKFNTSNAGDQHRLVDASTLSEEILKQQNLMEKGAKPDKSVIISPYFCRMILDHLSSVWGSPPKRKTTRKELTGTLELACGLNPVFYFLNNEKPFIAPVTQDTDIDAGHHDYALADSDTSETYAVDLWELVDQSARGFAVIKNIKPTYNTRVGDLVIINTRNQERKWAIGVIRWLMIKQGVVYKIGVQILSVNTRPVAIRACSGSAEDTRYRRALLVRHGSNSATSVITSKGLYIRNREIEIYQDGKLSRTRAVSLTESTLGFEQFEVADQA